MAFTLIIGFQVRETQFKTTLREKKKICWKNIQSFHIVEIKMSGKIMSPEPFALLGIFVVSFYTNEYNLGVVKTLEILRTHNLERKDTLPSILVK